MAQPTLYAPLADDPITMTTALAPAPLPLGVQLRGARESDAEAIEALQQRSGAGGVAAPHPPGPVLAGEEGEPLPGGCQVALDEQGAVIACALAVLQTGGEPGPVPQLLDVCTDPSWRGRGLGRAVLIATMRAAAGQGDRIGLAAGAPDDLVRLCRHHGFSEGEPGTGENAPTAWAQATAQALAQSSRPLDAGEVARAAGGQAEVDPALLAAVGAPAPEPAAAAPDPEASGPRDPDEEEVGTPVVTGEEPGPTPRP